MAHVRQDALAEVDAQREKAWAGRALGGRAHVLEVEQAGARGALKNTPEHVMWKYIRFWCESHCETRGRHRRGRVRVGRDATVSGGAIRERALPGSSGAARGKILKNSSAGTSLTKQRGKLLNAPSAMNALGEATTATAVISVPFFFSSLQVQT